MTRKRPKQRSGRKRQASPPVKLSLRKKLLFSAITVPLVLVMLELALALFGVQPTLYESDPYVGFAPVPLFVEEERSEERRVGKECRSRWSREHEKKKKNHII